MSDDYVGEDFDSGTFSVKDLYNALYGYVGLPFPAGASLSSFTPNNPLGLGKALLDQYKKTILGIDMIMPLTIGVPVHFLGNKLSDWEIPTEPLISIVGGHRIKKRYPNHSKKGGSIKERWSSDDYQITIKGVLVNFNNPDEYPEDQVANLRDACNFKGSLPVKNTMFRIFGIERIVIEDYDIPFTEGVNMQAFTIKASSDELFDALLTEV